MKKTVVSFICSSPDELKKLADDLRMVPRPNEVQYASVGLRGSSFLISPFQIPRAQESKIKEYLISEAIELLSLPAEDISLDYQIIGAEGVVSGYFICMPKNTFREYLSLLHAAELIPLCVTAGSLKIMNAFLKKIDILKERFCYLDFSEDARINLAVFFDGNCELIREIPYETLDEAKTEIIQSLRSVSAKSSLKECHCIYLSGKLDDKQQIIRDIESTLQAKSKSVEFKDVNAALAQEQGYFRLDLLNSCLNLFKLRTYIVKGAVMLMLGLTMSMLVVTGHLVSMQRRLDKLKTDYDPKEFQYAQGLWQKLENTK